MKKQKEIEKLRELLSTSKVCMLSTYNTKEGIHTRPMSYHQIDDDGVIWFFTNEYSPKMKEISFNNQINISFINEGKNNYVTLKASASLVTDKVKMEALFNPIIKAWFPRGLDDPKLALLKADVTSAEYWDNSSNTMVFLFNIVQALFTETMFHEGEHGKIKL